MKRQYSSIEKEGEKIFIVTFADFEPTDAEFEEYLASMLNIYHKDKEVVFILDGSKARYLSAKLRIRQGKWLAEHDALIKEKCLMHIYVIPNPIVNFILKGIFIIKNPPVEYKVVKTIGDARQAAKDVLVKIL